MFVVFKTKPDQQSLNGVELRLRTSFLCLGPGSPSLNSLMKSAIIVKTALNLETFLTSLRAAMMSENEDENGRKADLIPY